MFVISNLPMIKCVTLLWTIIISIHLWKSASVETAENTFELCFNIFYTNYKSYYLYLMLICSRWMETFSNLLKFLLFFQSVMQIVWRTKIYFGLINQNQRYWKHKIDVFSVIHTRTNIFVSWGNYFCIITTDKMKTYLF